MKMTSKIGPSPQSFFCPPPLKELPEFCLTATPQLTLNRNCYHMSKPEMEYNKIGNVQGV